MTILKNMKGISYLLALVLLALLVFFAFKDEKEGVSFKPDGKTLNMPLESLDGNRQSLTDYRGNILLVNFWATWCPPCKEEMPMFEELYRKYADKNFRIVAVNMDTNPSSLKDFLSKNPYSFGIYRTDERVIRELNISGFPTSYLVDVEGKVCKVRLGIYRELERDIKDLLEKGGRC